MMVSARVVNTHSKPFPVSVSPSPPAPPPLKGVLYRVPVGEGRFAPLLVAAGNSYGKANLTPYDLPIQLACMVRTRSGQSAKPLSDANNSSAYFVMAR